MPNKPKKGPGDADHSFKLIKTSDPEWLKVLSKCYKEKIPVRFIDDANVGIDPESQTLLEMGHAAGLGARGWVGVIVSLGVSVFGAWIIVLAILDPDPTSKLWLLIASGAILTYTGGHNAIKLLTNTKPPGVKLVRSNDQSWEFMISWE